MCDNVALFTPSYNFLRLSTKSFSLNSFSHVSHWSLVRKGILIKGFAWDKLYFVCLRWCLGLMELPTIASICHYFNRCKCFPRWQPDSNQICCFAIYIIPHTSFTITDMSHFKREWIIWSFWNRLIFSPFGISTFFTHLGWVGLGSTSSADFGFTWFWNDPSFSGTLLSNQTSKSTDHFTKRWMVSRKSILRFSALRVFLGFGGPPDVILLHTKLFYLIWSNINLTCIIIKYLFCNNIEGHTQH